MFFRIISKLLDNYNSFRNISHLCFDSLKQGAFQYAPLLPINRLSFIKIILNLSGDKLPIIYSTIHNLL